MMLRMVLGAVAAALLLGEAAAQEPPPLRDDGTISGITVTELARDVYQFAASYDGYVDGTNSLVVVTRDGVLIYDTFARPSTARAALARIREITDKPVRYIVNSHWHPDHWTGNEVYAAAFPDVTIISTRQTEAYMRDVAASWVTLFTLRRQQLLDRRAARTEPLASEADVRERIRLGMLTEIVAVNRAYPTRMYEDEITLRFGGRVFQLRSEFGDASYSTTLYMPRERIIAVGDIVVHPMTWTANGYMISPWIDTLHRLDEAEWNMLVPGHGALQRDRDYVRLVAEFFEAVRSQVRAALREGVVTEDEVLARLDTSAFKTRFPAEFAEDVDYDTADLGRSFYRELRDGMVSRP